MKIIVADLIDPKETAMVGRDDGRTFRSNLEKRFGPLVNMEKSNEKIYLIFPKNIITMNKSFFLGAFADRILKLGKEEFVLKYDFSSSEYIQSKIESYSEFAVKSSSINDIVNG